MDSQAPTALAVNFGSHNFAGGAVGVLTWMWEGRAVLGC